MSKNFLAQMSEGQMLAHMSEGQMLTGQMMPRQILIWQYSCTVKREYVTVCKQGFLLRGL